MLQALPYHPDSSSLFAAIADRPWSIFLDSGRPDSDHGRYDIITTDPVATIITRNGVTSVSTSTGVAEFTNNPLDLIRSTLGEPQDSTVLPFIGGAIGYAAYGLANYLPCLPSISHDETDMPEMCFGIYDWAFVSDHKKQKSYLIRNSRCEMDQEHWDQLIELFSHVQTNLKEEPFRITGSIQSNLTIQQYAAAFEQIQKYIYDGDCYQVNFAQRFGVECQGDPWSAYKKLRSINPSPFSAYINTPYGQVLSSSPERFLQVKGSQVETKPIKGTRPRSDDSAVDNKLSQELSNSEKDRAENLMIVDLLRNDLGKSCIPGSIDAPDLFKVESFPKVHHLVSRVTGKLSGEHDALSLLSGCFPGGSITGAPKYRAMEIIEELEPDPRGIYCGTVGYIGYDGSMDTNIAIRTMVHKDGQMQFAAGGGIVSDSDMASEYQETLDKVSAMFEMLKSTESLHKQP
jgi:para-aminobenzoate synthetase component 1